MDKYIEALRLIDRLIGRAAETLRDNPEAMAYLTAISIIAEEPFIHYNEIDD